VENPLTRSPHEYAVSAYVYVAPPCEWEKMTFSGPFLAFFKNFATSKNLLQKSKCAHHAHTRRHLYAFSVLRYRLQRKTVTYPESHPDRHPANFAIREPQCSALGNLINYCVLVATILYTGAYYSVCWTL